MMTRYFMTFVAQFRTIIAFIWATYNDKTSLLSRTKNVTKKCGNQREFADEDDC